MHSKLKHNWFYQFSDFFFSQGGSSDLGPVRAKGSERGHPYCHFVSRTRIIQNECLAFRSAVEMDISCSFPVH